MHPFCHTAKTGTLGQLLMPLTVMVALIWKNQDNFGASIGLWWLAQSVMDVAPYVNDARAGRLMLLGGVTGQQWPGPSGAVIDPLNRWALWRAGVVAWLDAGRLDRALMRFEAEVERAQRRPARVSGLARGSTRPVPDEHPCTDQHAGQYADGDAGHWRNPDRYTGNMAGSG